MIDFVGVAGLFFVTAVTEIIACYPQPRAAG